MLAPSATSTARERRIRRALRLLEARFGPGVAWRLADARPRWTSPALPTGSLGLDLATGLDGYPRGQLVELFGPPAAGKATLLASALAAAQRRGGLVALIDVLGLADPEALAGAGVDLDALIVAQPADAVDAVRCLALLAESAALDLIGLVSIADLRAILPPEDADVPPAVAVGRLLSKGLRRVVRALRDAPTAVVVTNERLPGEGERSVGGLALRHFAALRIAVEPLAPPVEDLEGQRLPARLTVVKHKLGVPGGVADVDLVYGRGVDRAGELLRLGLACGAIARCGAALVFGREPLGKDAGRARRRLTEDDGLADAVAAAIAAAPPRVGPVPPQCPAFGL